MDCPVDFKAHLTRQLSFLLRSCQSYDAGFHDEAVRIATVVRVIIHGTGSSTSLLKHLGATNISLISTVSELTTEVVSFVGMGRYRVGFGEGSFLPQLGDGWMQKNLPVSEWWSQVVMVLDSKHQITRKNIVLAASNKDGGAHVDARLTDEYAALAKDGAVGSFVYTTQGNRDEKSINNAHFVSLRQMGYELLNSPQLLELRCI